MNMDARDRLLELLSAHQPEDERERHDLQRMLHYAAALQEPFSRTQAEAHFTASAVLVDPTGGATCLVHHRKLDKWLQPGGHFEPADQADPARAALREVWEETGCASVLLDAAAVPFDVDIHAIPAHGAEPAHLHLDLRVLARAQDASLAHDAVETRGAEWLGWEEALARASDPSLRRALCKARRLLGR